ncbi:hypothetical protein BJ138DRAFT_701115 [Hygrophoropsis aurantiaca]|uniref:Uncharacterized protein n=1 Tax=Hygrophoropsis aurantiaca TaxID=72124 RepID=A0ACB8AIF6_9AGAM|nr:hypothetical protein BJ138DRAFT_701115 [Hygrophoropsis aurantiaca]
MYPRTAMSHGPRRYYAVRIGREGPCIYTTYNEYTHLSDGIKTRGFSGSSGKGFDTLQEAQRWLQEVPLNGMAVTHTTTHTELHWNFLQEADGNVFTGATSASTSTTISVVPNSANTIRQYPDFHAAPKSVWTEYESPLNVGKAQEYMSETHLDRSFSEVPVDQLPPPAPPFQQEIKLSPEQRLVLDKVKSGKSIFFTGPAGKITYLGCYNLNP